MLTFVFPCLCIEPSFGSLIMSMCGTTTRMPCIGDLTILGSNMAPPLAEGTRGLCVCCSSERSRLVCVQVAHASTAVFAGKDPSRALAQSSLKPEDCKPDYEDLEEKDKKVLDDWLVFFSNRYNIVGKVVKDSSNL
jgi:hypothetical protein